MAKFTIDLDDRLVPGLNRAVAAYNGNNGTSLTVAEWLLLHAQEIALTDDLTAEHQRLVSQANTDVILALQAFKERLITGEGDIT